MMTILRNAEEMLAAFQANNATTSNGIVSLVQKDYDDFALRFTPYLSIRLDEELPLNQMLDKINLQLKQELKAEVASLIFCIEFLPEEPLMMKEMGDVHEFINGFNDEVDIKWSLASNDHLSGHRAIEIFVFSEKEK